MSKAIQHALTIANSTIDCPGPLEINRKIATMGGGNSHLGRKKGLSLFGVCLFFECFLRFGKSGLPPKKNLFGGKTCAGPPKRREADNTERTSASSPPIPSSPRLLHRRPPPTPLSTAAAATALIESLPQPLSPSSRRHRRHCAAITEPSPPTPPSSCRRPRLVTATVVKSLSSHFLRDACSWGDRSC
jgi:hypothetical protein